MIRVVLIGAGNVASHLLKAFTSSNHVEVVQVFNRNKKSLDNLDYHGPVTTDITTLYDADCYLIAIHDDVIYELSSSLPFSGKLVIHTSGSVSLEEMDPKNRRGVFYPLQTFSKNRDVDFSQIPICLEAETKKDLLILQKLSEGISQNQYIIDSRQRKQLHLAAVFVCNFVNYLYHIGHEITEENNLPFDILKPLIKETAAKIENASPEEMQTGPAKRNDKKTMEKHLDALTLQEHREIYSLLSAAITKTYGRKKL